MGGLRSVEGEGVAAVTGETVARGAQAVVDRATRLRGKVCVLEEQDAGRARGEVELREDLGVGALGVDVEEAVYEYPLPSWRDVPGSKVRPLDSLRAARDLVRIRRRYLRGPGQAPGSRVRKPERS